MIDEAIRLALAPLLDPIAAELRAQRHEIQRLREALGTGRWVSRREAAAALGVSLDSIDRRISDRSLRSRKLGRTVRVLLDLPVTDDEVAQLAAEAAS
jgi:excisionase family DNA binding protein